MRETDTHYFFYKHQFGQWTKRFIRDRRGITYNCCEQYMMFQKSILFRDEKTAEEIINESDPYKQKKLGRKIQNFDEKNWISQRYMIVWEGNMLKFTQHADLQDRLLATCDKVLVEASPVDKIWGVGLSSDDDRILDPQNWKGLNLLGRVLMNVRDTIINGI